MPGTRKKSLKEIRDGTPCCAGGQARGRRGGLSPCTHGLSPPRRANAALCPARQRELLRRKSSPRLGGQTRETAGARKSATGGRPGDRDRRVRRRGPRSRARARPNSGIAQRGGEGRVRSPTGARGATFFFFSFPLARPRTPHSRPPPPTKSANPRCAATGDRPPRERAPGRKRENSRSLNEQPPPGRRPFAAPPGASCPALARQGISGAI